MFVVFWGVLRPPTPPPEKAVSQVFVFVFRWFGGGAPKKTNLGLLGVLLPFCPVLFMLGVFSFICSKFRVYVF